MSFPISFYDEIINLLILISGTNNIYELIIFQQNKFLFNDYINELVNLKPNFEINIVKNEKSYREFPYITIDKQIFKFTIITNYQKDTINVNYNIKFSQILDNNLKVMSILLITEVKDNTNKRFVKLKSFYNDYNKTKIYNEKRTNNSETNLKFYIKICYIYSFLQSYYVMKFTCFYSDLEVVKLSKNQIKNILLNKFLKYEDYSQVFQFLDNWLKNDNNLKEKLGTLLKNILWNEVPLNKLFEFIFKFHYMVDKYDLHKSLENSIDSRVKIENSKFILITVKKTQIIIIRMIHPHCLI